MRFSRCRRAFLSSLHRSAVQATSGGGGWPMSVFLTPDLQPFLGGTYFPPQDAYGRPGDGTNREGNVGS